MTSTLFTQTGYARQLQHDSGSWSQVEGNFDLGRLHPTMQGLHLWTTGEARIFNNFNHLAQGVIRFAPGYRVHDNAIVYLGYTWVPNNPLQGQAFDEHDINQAITWALQPDWGKLSGRTMVEWRFVNNDSQVAARLRQKFRADFPLPVFANHLSLIGWEEAFFNLNSVDWGPVGGFDQNRAFAGLGWQLDNAQHYRLELGYMNQLIHHVNKNDDINHMLFTGLQIKF